MINPQGYSDCLEEKMPQHPGIIHYLRNPSERDPVEDWQKPLENQNTSLKIYFKNNFYCKWKATQSYANACNPYQDTIHIFFKVILFFFCCYCFAFLLDIATCEKFMEKSQFTGALSLVSSHRNDLISITPQVSWKSADFQISIQF